MRPSIQSQIALLNFTHETQMDAQEAQAFEKEEAHNSTSVNQGSGFCCLCFSVLFLSLALLSAATLIILLILKPKKPIFHLHSIQLGSFKLNASTKEVDVSSSMAALTFHTQNPNKIGIRYSPSKLGILYESNPVGAIEVPMFYQPPNGINVTVLMHVLIERFNLSALINGNHVEAKIVGRIGAQAHVLNFPLPKITVSLVCKITLDYDVTMISKGMDFIKRHKALVLSNFPHLSQKCSLALI